MVTPSDGFAVADDVAGGEGVVGTDDEGGVVGPFGEQAECYASSYASNLPASN